MSQRDSILPFTKQKAQSVQLKANISLGINLKIIVEMMETDLKFDLTIMPIVKELNATICTEAIWHMGRVFFSVLLNQMFMETI